ncbi:FHA domain-containing protein [Parabacteroides sp. Marseille-P3160]|uniref:FHA domain-containing protein n=1 Tax=Parabacteroides sp. Marseille-P3160 TaxID=1917887 RepID=UPI0009BB41F3|nr:FHA domain-containing protein [Parabacteroides sp. Marseille-P3160]
MISIKCPHCRVGLKIDEEKIPEGITSFHCPKCRHEIPLTILQEQRENAEPSTDTILVYPTALSGIGKLTVLANENTPEQTFPLHEGVQTIGRKAQTSTADIRITTGDRSMSRNHLQIEVKKTEKSGYKHYLTDNNSKNQTLYNNNYIGPGEVVVLKDKDEIIIGCTALRFNE